MNLKQPWIVATVTLAAVGFGDSVAYACEERSYEQQVPIVEIPDNTSASGAPLDVRLRSTSAGSRTARPAHALYDKQEGGHAI